MLRRTEDHSSGSVGQHIGNAIDLTGLDEDSDSDATLNDDSSQRGSQHQFQNMPGQRQSAERLYQEDLHELPVYDHYGAVLRPKKTVELANGEFLKIEAILRSTSSGEVFLKGFGFTRNSQVQDMLEKQLNEVCWMLRYDALDGRGILEQSMVCYNVSEVVMIRRLILTNDMFDHHSYRQSEEHTWTVEKVSERSHLVCRWKALFIPRNECFLMRLSPDECTVGYSAQPAALREIFLSALSDIDISLGSNPNSGSSHRDQTLPTSGPRQPQYTFADAFCGAGGASRAAEQANIAIMWAFDSDPAAISSYRLNFPNANTWSAEVENYLICSREENGKTRIDILHISTPCQPHSPNHTRPGANDKVNEAVFFSVLEIVKSVRPRIVTLEQTLGLGFPRKRLWLRALIHIFTHLSFSVRWRTFDLREFGLPQHRKRFILFASWQVALALQIQSHINKRSPGEPLPEFPKPTHRDPRKIVENPALPPFHSVNDAISSIPAGTSWHNPTEYSLQCQGDPYDGSTPLAYTICCGNSLGHPSGTRKFTLRELACLQGVPTEHKFAGRFHGDKTRVQRQIGNMVPPSAFKPFLLSIRSALQRLDRT